MNRLLQELVYARIDVWNDATAANRRTPSPELAAKEAETKRALLGSAMEWLASGRVTGLDTRDIVRVCKAAGGTEEQCAP